MIPDSECLKIMTEILSELELGQFKIKVSERKRVKYEYAWVDDDLLQ